MENVWKRSSIFMLDMHKKVGPNPIPNHPMKARVGSLLNSPTIALQSRASYSHAMLWVRERNESLERHPSGYFSHFLSWLPNIFCQKLLKNIENWHRLFTHRQ